MANGKQILCVVDPAAEEQPARDRAARLAKACGASLELFVCDYDQHLAGGKLFDSKSLEKARQSLLQEHVERLEKRAQALIEQGLDVTVDARWGRPLDREIVRKVVETRPLLVAKDTRYQPGLRRTLLSNADWNLIRSCPVPLLLVKPGPLADVPQIVAAVDPVHEHDKPAELDQAILAFATELTTALRGRLHVLHAYDAAPLIAAAAAGPAGAVAPIQEVSASLEHEHRAALDALLRGFAIPASDVHFRQGVADRVLVDAAAELCADFVVMGAVSRSGLKRVFVGSTAERVLDRLPCDLIVVKPPGFQAAPPD
ncbi:MAG TPA: universal stress protein [Gammaproteobacteria bacterium]